MFPFLLYSPPNDYLAPQLHGSVRLPLAESIDPFSKTGGAVQLGGQPVKLVNSIL